MKPLKYEKRDHKAYLVYAVYLVLIVTGRILF